MRHIYYTCTAVTLFLLGCGDNKNIEPTSKAMDASSEIEVTRGQFETNGFQLGKMEERTFPKTIEASGIIDVPPENRASITALMGGFVRKTSLLVGNKVKKGQLLVVLENQEFVKMQQEYLEVFNQLDFLKAEFERNRTLFEEKIASQKNFLQAKSRYESAKAKYKGLREQLTMLNISPAKVERGTIVSKTSIYAPMDGSITKMNVSIGSFVSPATEIMEIVNNDHVHLELTVFEKDILKVKKDQNIKFKIPEASTDFYNAKIYLVGASIDEAKRTIKVHGHLEKENSSLLPGMFVNAIIMTDTVKSWSLPSESIIESEGSPYVLKLISDTENGNIYERVRVSLGHSFDGYTEIKSMDNLNGSDQFLVKGAFDLAD